MPTPAFKYQMNELKKLIKIFDFVFVRFRAERENRHQGEQEVSEK